MRAKPCICLLLHAFFVLTTHCCLHERQRKCDCWWKKKKPSAARDVVPASSCCHKWKLIFSSRQPEGRIWFNKMFKKKGRNEKTFYKVLPVRVGCSLSPLRAIWTKYCFFPWAIFEFRQNRFQSNQKAVSCVSSHTKSFWFLHHRRCSFLNYKALNPFIKQRKKYFLLEIRKTGMLFNWKAILKSSAKKTHPVI